MNEKTKQLLKKIGVTDQTVADLADDEKAKDLDVKEIQKATLANLRDVFKNDESFTSELEKGFRAALLSSKENKLKKAFDFLGLSDEDFAALPEKTKFDDLIGLLATKAQDLKKKAGGSGDKDAEIEKLNTTIRDLKAEKKKLEEETIPGIRQEVALERRQMKLDGITRKALDKHDLVIDKDFAHGSVMAQISGGYDLDLQEDGSVRILNKGKETEAFDDNNQKLTLDALIGSTVKAAKLVKESNGGSGGKKGEGEGDQGGGGREAQKTNLPGLQKAQAHAKEMKGEPGE